MDPTMLLAAISAISSGVSAATGNKGERGSTYSQGAQSGLEDALNSVKQMRGGADIRQNQGYQQGNQWLMDLFNDPEFFKNFEAPLQRQFQEQTVPDLANRFASMGSGGALGSTAFRNQLGREGSNLSTNIAALRGGMQQQGIPQLLQYAQQPVSNYQNLLNTATTPTQNTYQPPSGGFAGGIASSSLSGLIQSLIGQSQGQGANTSSPYQSSLTPGYDAQFRNAGVY